MDFLDSVDRSPPGTGGLRQNRPRLACRRRAWPPTASRRRTKPPLVPGTIQRFSTGRILTWTARGIIQIWSKGAIGSPLGCTRQRIRCWVCRLPRKPAVSATAAATSSSPAVPSTGPRPPGPIWSVAASRHGGRAAAARTAFWGIPGPPGLRTARRWLSAELPGRNHLLVTGDRSLDCEGRIGGRYSASGANRGSLGYPVAIEACGQPASGCIQRFQGGTIYWSPATGAWIVRGRHRQQICRCRRRTGGSLGYPTANRSCSGGQCIQSFQRGFISWTATAGTRLYPASPNARN